MSDALRPAGTRFEVTYPPRLGENTEDGGYEHISTWEVVAHREYIDAITRQPVMGEEVRWISSRRGRHWLEMKEEL